MKSIQTTCIIVLLLLAIHNIYAQTYSLKGIVSGPDDQEQIIPLSGAQVVIRDSINFDNTFYDSTDVDGRYLFEGLTPGFYYIYCNLTPYTTFSDSINLTKDDTLDIQLKRETQPEFATISGWVTIDETGEPVPGALISIYPFRAGVFKTTTDINGFYSSDLPEDNYFVGVTYAAGDNLNEYIEYYNNVRSYDAAELLELARGENLEGIDFGIPLPENAEEITISGTVKDTTGEGLGQVMVTALFSDGGFVSQTPRQPAFTNLSGQFQISFHRLNNISRVLIIRAEKEGYQTVFFELETDIFNAKAIELDFGDNFTDVDFELQPLQSGYEFSISGQVVNANNQPIEGVMIMATDSVNLGNHITFSSREGQYRIENLNKGQYYLHFSRNGYEPAWYEDNFLWENGQTIQLNETMSAVNYKMQPYKSMQGNSSLLAIVRDSDGFPLSGAMMVVVNPDSGKMKYTFSEKYGRTLLTELPREPIDLVVTKSGYKSYSEKIILDRTFNEMDIMLSEYATSVYRSPNQASVTQFRLENNYPNPFNPVTAIHYRLPAVSQVDLSIYNQLGEKIKTLVSERQPAGYYQIEWNAINMASGVYYYQLLAGRHREVKKMVLLR